MPFWKKKKKEEVQEAYYEIFGGATITKIGGQYEIRWKSPMITTIMVSSPPQINEDILSNQQGNVTKIETQECKLKIVTKDGDKRAFFSKM